ncbi:hypothetical protein [Erythrobacter sp. YJ-T3-07]|nr:hypothetical protein [Erythrobacter sp. YJ-T3-07]
MSMFPRTVAERTLELELANRQLLDQNRRDALLLGGTAPSGCPSP